MPAPLLRSYNAGSALGFSPIPNATGPIYVGAIGSSGAVLQLPPGWTAVRPFGVGWYRLIHDLGTTAYAVFATVRDAPKAVAMPSNYQETFFDVNTVVLPAASDTDHEFAFAVIALH